jgi:hypothetical protein
MGIHAGKWTAIIASALHPAELPDGNEAIAKGPIRMGFEW